MRAFCTHGAVPALERPTGLGSRIMKKERASDRRFPRQAKPGECPAQINSPHSSGTAARTQTASSAGAALSPLRPNPSLSLSLSSARSPRGSLLSTAPQSIGRAVPGARVSPPPPRPTAPGHRDWKKCEEEPQARLCACALWRAPPRPHPAPLSRTGTVGCGWGGMCSWGKVSAFIEGGRPAGHRNIPHS